MPADCLLKQHRGAGPSIHQKRIAASLWFRSVKGALNTIAGYESMHMIRKGQVKWLAKGDITAQVRFIHEIFGIAA